MTERTNALPVLKVTCTTTECASGLHCFLPNGEMRRAGVIGPCRDCGIELVDWDRVHHLRLEDLDYTFEALQWEFFRHRYWHIDFDQRALNHAKRKGRIALKQAAYRRLENSVQHHDPYRDGRQTPLTDNVIYYAQHAVAACCRKCMETWYGIPRESPLNEDQMHFLHGLICQYIDLRLPDLEDDGVKVPPIRSESG